MSEIPHRLTDERMCWLAVRDYCRQQSRKRGVLGMVALIMAAASRGASRTAMVSDSQRYDRSGKMGDYALAADDAARTLSADERAHLRATGEVPEWFLADVERRFTELRGRR